MADAAKTVGATDNAADAAKAAGTACSFTADTLVATPVGATPIVALDVGDQVLAWDETTGQTGVFTVTARWGHLDPVITLLTLAGEQLAATPEHPFFVVGRGWMPAESLQVGDQIQPADGMPGSVRAVQVVQRP